MAKKSMGFVVAMHAKLEFANGTRCREWLILARWGGSGQFLSISRTGVRARGGAAPLGLKPRSTALARLMLLPNPRGRLTFLLSPRLPRGIELAGDFIRTEGVVHLYKDAAKASGEGRCTSGRTRGCWRLAAIRAAWSGEFIESSTAANPRLAGPTTCRHASR